MQFISVVERENAGTGSCLDPHSFHAGWGLFQEAAMVGPCTKPKPLATKTPRSALEKLFAVVRNCNILDIKPAVS
jgi:hypothetical protein